MITSILKIQSESLTLLKNVDKSCVYIKVSGSTIVFLWKYEIQSVKIYLSNDFSMKDLRESSCINDLYDKSKMLIHLSQSRYINTVLKCFKYVTVKVVTCI